MKTIQKGFTLIELMIVIAIIGILAAIAIPAYQDYTIRSQVTEGLNLAGGLKTAVQEYYSNNGEWPTTLTQIGAVNAAGDAEVPPSGKYVESVTFTDTNGGTLLITYGLDANANIVGDTLALRPRLSSAGDVVWLCGYFTAAEAVLAGALTDPALASDDNVANTNIESKYLPTSCRDDTA
jgi:type IV pilus assembly protein PilA